MNAKKHLAWLSALGIVLAACGNPQEPITEPPADVSPGVTQTGAAPAITPIPGLTDTGFTAPDGRPLYKECIQEGAPLPPEIPTPIAAPEPIPTEDPARDHNQDKIPPSVDELPPVDIRTTGPADTTGWMLYESKCYGFSMLVPPHWRLGTSTLTGGEGPEIRDNPPFVNAGYQQGATAVMWAPRKVAKVEVSIEYVPGGADLRNKRIVLDQIEYLIERNDEAALGGKPARLTSVFLRGGPLPGVRLQLTAEAAPSWRFGISAYLPEPYDALATAELAAILGSIEFAP